FFSPLRSSISPDSSEFSSAPREGHGSPSRKTSRLQAHPAPARKPVPLVEPRPPREQPDERPLGRVPPHPLHHRLHHRRPDPPPLELRDHDAILHVEEPRPIAPYPPCPPHPPLTPPLT